MLNNISISMVNFYLIYVLKVAKDTNKKMSYEFWRSDPTEEELMMRYGDDPKPDPDNGSTSTPIALAIFPMIIFISSVLCSTSLNKLYLKIGRKKTFTLGAVF